MEFDFIFKLMLVTSFLVVSMAFSVKLLTEAYLWWLQVKEGVQIINEQREQEEDMDEQ